MTVQKLIEELQKLDPALEVFYNDGEWGPTEIRIVAIDPKGNETVTTEYLEQEVPYTYSEDGVEKQGVQILKGFPKTTRTFSAGVVLS